MTKNMLPEEKIIQLYNDLNHELFVYIFRFVHSQEQAEDLLQDCFTNLIAYAQSRPVQEETLRPFLYRTAHNLCINYTKKHSKITMTSLDEGLFQTHSDDPDKQLAYEELNNKIYQLLAEVDDLARSIFIMKKELNLSVPEIAKNIGKSERTVRRKLNNVLDILESHLKASGLYPDIFIVLIKLMRL